MVDKLSRLGQTIQTEWQPQVDLLITRFNNKLPQFVSPVPDSLAWAVDALSLSWEDLNPSAFPPVAILGKMVEKLQDYPCNTIILTWFLVAMSSQIPLSQPNLRAQPSNQIFHMNLSKLNLHAGFLKTSAIRDQVVSQAVAARIEAPQTGSTRSVYTSKWTIFTKWCHSNQVDFKAYPIKSIADFLLYLFQDKKLQPSTIDGYRSAIAEFAHQCG